MLVYPHPTLSKTVGLVGREKIILPGCPMCLTLNVICLTVFKIDLTNRLTIKNLYWQRWKKKLEFGSFKQGRSDNISFILQNSNSKEVQILKIQLIKALQKRLHHLIYTKGSSYPEVFCKQYFLKCLTVPDYLL